jgi:hypothetical protein
MISSSPLKPFPTTDYLYFVEKGLFHIFLEKDKNKVPLRFKRHDKFIISLEEIFPSKKPARISNVRRFYLSNIGPSKNKIAKDSDEFISVCDFVDITNNLTSPCIV